MYADTHTLSYTIHWSDSMSLLQQKLLCKHITLSNIEESNTCIPLQAICLTQTRTLYICICQDILICTVSVPLKLCSRNLLLFLPILHFQLLTSTPSHLHTHPLKPNTLFPPLVSSPGGTLSGNDVMVNVLGFPLTFHAQHHHNYKDTTHASIRVSITSHIIAPASLCMSV